METSTVLSVLLFLASAFYMLVHVGLVTGKKRARSAPSQEQPFVSVIVAARNEQSTIGKLLQCLSDQTYLHCEVIVVNDRSTDNTANIIAEYRMRNPAIQMIEVTEVPIDMPAKKNALRSGIRASKGEILCFTDADCFPPPCWIEELVQQFQPDVGLVAGYSPYLPHSDRNVKISFLAKTLFAFIRYEEFRAALWSVGSIGWNMGWLCTGRNLAYRRKVYDAVGGFEAIKRSISGDDDLFMQMVRQRTNWKIRYLQSMKSFVPTLMPADFWSFVNQRIRHFSASKFFTVPMMFFFFLYHAVNVLLFSSPFLFFMGLTSIQSVIASICVKLIADAVLILSSMRTFQSESFRFTFILMEILYMLYNSLIGPLGLVKEFHWKQD